VTSLILGGWC